MANRRQSPRLFFRRDRQNQAIEFIGHDDLAGQSGTALTLEALRVFEQIEFVIGDALNLVAPFGIYIDMAGRAGTHAAAQRLDTVVDLAERLHDAQAVSYLEDVLAPFPVRYLNRRHFDAQILDRKTARTIPQRPAISNCEKRARPVPTPPDGIVNRINDGRQKDRDDPFIPPYNRRQMTTDNEPTAEFRSEIAALIAEVEACLGRSHGRSDREYRFQEQAFRERCDQALRLARPGTGQWNDWRLRSGDAYRIAESLRLSLAYFRNRPDTQKQ